MARHTRGAQYGLYGALEAVAGLNYRGISGAVFWFTDIFDAHVLDDSVVFTARGVGPNNKEQKEEASEEKKAVSLDEEKAAAAGIETKEEEEFQIDDTIFM